MMSTTCDLKLVWEDVAARFAALPDYDVMAAGVDLAAIGERLAAG